MDSRGSERKVPTFTNRRKIVILVSVLAVAAMLGAGVAGAYLASNNGRAEGATAAVTATQHTAFTYPTTTMQEPGYTNGTYVMAATSDIQYLNIYEVSDLYSFYLLNEIYDSLYTTLPNQTIAPWLATGYTFANVSAHPFNTTDPLTGSNATVNYIYNVSLRPGVQWTDWTPANSASTYVYDGIPMNNYTVQSADVVLSWLILQSSADFAGTYLNIVNVVPVNNLTVSFYLNAQSATFLTISLLNPILPYHLWVNHDWATSTPSAWNYTGKANGYDVWNMGYSSSSGTASGLVGTGPFMFNGGYGMPAGTWEPGVYWNEYVNPHYFAQYVSSLKQFTPKIYELMVPLFGSESSAVTALTLGQVDTIEGGIDPTFISTVNAAANTFIYYHPGSGYSFMQFNSYPSHAPWNITAFRQAMQYAVDKTYIDSVIEQGYQVPGNSIIPLSDQVWHNFSLPQFNYNPSQTLTMLHAIPGMAQATSGQWLYYGKPVTGNIEITVSSLVPLYVEAAQLVANEWTSLGIPTTVTQVSFIKLVADLIASNYQQIALGITGVSGDVTSFLFDVYNSINPTVFYQGPFSNLTYNGVSYTGPQIQSLFNNLTTKLNTVTNLQQRIGIADEIQGIAAYEATQVIFGYGVDIYPFYNGTFTNITETALPQGAMIYWTFDSVHLKAAATPTPPAALPTQLSVGVVADKSVYFDGQYGNITIQVRNQFGQPVSGVTVAVGYNPTGGVLNISSATGTTNSAGQYVFEFKVFQLNQGVYTSDYGGSVNVTVAAFSNGGSSVEPGLGYTHIDTAPMPVQYVASAPPTIVKAMGSSMYNITVENLAGQPVSGYRYSIGVLTGAATISPTVTGASNPLAQTENNVSTYNYLTGSGYFGAAVNNPFSQPVFGFSTDSAVAVGPNGDIFVANSASGTVSEFLPVSDMGTFVPLTDTSPYGELVNTYTVGTNPSAIAFNATGFMIVANFASNNLTVIDLSTGQSVQNIPFGAPSSMAVSGNLLYVTSLASGTVAVLNESTWTTVATIAVGVNPDAMAFSPVNGFLYVTNSGSDNVTAINTTSMQTVANITVGTTPENLIFNMTGYLYVANAGSGNLTVVSNVSNAVVANVAVGGAPGAMAMDGSGYLYVANAPGNNVTVVSNDSAATVADIAVGTGPGAIAYNPSEGLVYVANVGSDNVTVISSATMTTMPYISNDFVSTVSGVTGTNGVISVNLSGPSALYSYGANGPVSLSYLFIGDYSSGGAVTGAAPYQSIGEMTSAVNPNGFGAQQPVEIPIQVQQAATSSAYNINLTLSSSTISPTNTATVTVVVTNSTGAPVPKYSVTLTSQNALGANRGYFNGIGTQIQAFNPNAYFGSQYLPGLKVETNATGVATATFNPTVFTSQYGNEGTTFGGFVGSPYTDSYLIPLDEFQIAAMGKSGGINSTTLVSQQVVNNPAPAPVSTAFVGGASILNGVNVIAGNSSYTLYVNSTENTQSGPSMPNINVNVSVSLGTVNNATYATGSTGSSGSFSTTFAVPNVSVMTPVKITVTTTYNGATTTSTTTYYVMPHYTAPAQKKTSTTSAPIPAYMYGALGAFVVLTVVFAALYTMSRTKGRKGGGEQPPQQ